MLPGLWNNHSHLGDLLPDEPLLRAAIRAGRNAMDALKAGFTTTRIAVMAGAESIEHGNDLSDDTIRMMAEAGTFLDPTIQCNLSTEFIAERERLIREAGYVDPPEVVEGRVRVSHADERTPERARMADRKATMVFFNTEEDLNEAMRSGLPGATDLSMQDLRANESPAVGDADYMAHVTRDAAYEEIWHLIHDYGIKPMLPEMIAEMRTVNDEAAAATKSPGRRTPRR